MEEKERLAKLLEKFSCPHSVTFCDRCGNVYDGKGCVTYTDTAESLIQNGVTIATDTNVWDKWVKTSERKPTKEDADRDERVLAWDSIKKYAFTPTWYYVNLRTDKFTHWMPLPQPPKGVR